MLEDEQTFHWLKQRVDALARVLGETADLGAEMCPPHFCSLLYQGGLELLEQNVALMPERLVDLMEVLPGTDVVHIVSCVSGVQQVHECRCDVVLLVQA